MVPPAVSHYSVKLLSRGAHLTAVVAACPLPPVLVCKGPMGRDLVRSQAWNSWCDTVDESATNGRLSYSVHYSGPCVMRGMAAVDAKLKRSLEKCFSKL